ncbi:MAG TPA: hypothetical protein VFZ00_01470 [Solirubrobacter sp.]|nr:hypothetical protein [Solirubrobacter sp.]
MALYVEVTGADGDVTELHPSSRRAEDRPQGITCSTARGDGFKNGSFWLPRRADRTYDDIRRYDQVRFIDEQTGDLAWEGYVASEPQTMDTTHRLQVECVGYMQHLKDRKIRALIIDQDLNRWSAGASLMRQVNNFTRTFAAGSIAADQTNGVPNIVQTLDFPTGAAASVNNTYDAGPGLTIGAIYYAWQRITSIPTADANYQWAIYTDSDDAIGSPISSTGNLRAAGPGSGTLAVGAGSRFALIEFLYNAAVAGNGQQRLGWGPLAVYGDQGLPLIGSSQPYGVAASDVIRWIVKTFYPLLNTAGVQDTSWPIHQLRFDDVFGYDALTRINSWHRYGLEVWDDRTLYFAPPDLDTTDWTIDGGDDAHPITASFPGPADDDQPNGIRVKYRDWFGTPLLITPDDDSRLAWDDPEHEATRHGRTVWTDYEFQQPVDRDDAIEVGRLALIEANQNRAPAVFTCLSGEVLNGEGIGREAWRVRAGKTMAIVSHPEDQPRLITETTYTDDDGRLVVNVDNSLATLEGIQDRWMTELEARGLI